MNDVSPDRLTRAVRRATGIDGDVSVDAIAWPDGTFTVETTRFAHVPSGDPPDVNGLRFCLICDEAWPCGPRRGRDAHEREHRMDGTELPSYSGDPMGATYPGEPE